MSSDTGVSYGCGYGKIIIVGEHAVVYGHQAIAAAIGRKVQCQVNPSKECRLIAPAESLDRSAQDPHPATKAFHAIWKASGREPVTAQISGDLPIASGLGSSAALCVALASALRPELPQDELQALANLGEETFHEHPSGIDVAMSCAGGIGVYSKTSGLRALHCKPLPLVVALSGTRRSTLAMVRLVKSQLHQLPNIASQIIEEIGRLAADCVELISSNQHQGLAENMNRNHRLLCDLGVSTPSLDSIVAACMNAGALAAKLTGAGGGGAVIALAPNCQHEVVTELKSRGIQAFTTEAGHETQPSETI